MNRLLPFAAVAALAGCDPAAPPSPAASSSAAPSATVAAAPAPSARASAPVPVVAPTTGASTAPPTPPPGDGGVTEPAHVCEVEISGHVKAPHTPAGTPNPEMFVAIGDCLGGGKVVGHGGTTDGRFFVEVFVPWGSDLTLCSAVVPGPGKPSTLYGKAKIPMHAAAHGEVEFKDVLVELAKGAPKPFEWRP